MPARHILYFRRKAGDAFPRPRLQATTLGSLEAASRVAGRYRGGSHLSSVGQVKVVSRSAKDCLD